MSSEFQSILMFAAILPGKKLRYVLAEDDEDDVMFFRDAISELKLNVELEVAKDGSQLMEILHYQPFPDVIFLDLNMPLRNGLECLLGHVRVSVALRDQEIPQLAAIRNATEGVPYRLPPRKLTAVLKARCSLKRLPSFSAAIGLDTARR